MRDGVIDEVVALFPQARVIDFDSWFAASEFGNDPTSRPDGVHVAIEVATQISEQYLGAAIVRAAVLP